MIQGKIGLVLSGGGGKGAYQIGIWKALMEFGIKPNVVSGTSVGALNGAMIVINDHEKAEEIWNTITPEEMLSLNMESLSNRVVDRLTSMDIDLGKLPKSIRTRGLFSKKGLESLLDKGVDEEKIQSSPIPFYACAHNKAKNQIRFFHVNRYDQPTIRKILLATSALPGIFDEVEIDGEIYSDGGFYWGNPLKNIMNTPILPVYQHNCDVIIVAALSRDELIDRKAFPNTKIIPIIPRENLGGSISGTLDFSNEGAKRRIQQGYDDTRQMLGKLDKILHTEAAYEELWNEIANQEMSYIATKETVNQSESERLEMRRSVKDLTKLIQEDTFDNHIEWTVEEVDNLLFDENYALLTRIERENMNLQISTWMEKNKDNSQLLSQAAMEAVSYAAQVEGQANELYEQGIFARMIGSITGKNHQLHAENQRNLAMGQYAAVQLIHALQQKGHFTLELAAAINNKANWLYTEIGGLSDSINKQYLDFYRSIGTIYFKVRTKLMEDQERLASLENRVSILEWQQNIKVHSYNGIQYRNLSLVDQVLCITNDFYRLTSGDWNIKELQSLNSALDQLEIENQTLSLEQFFTELVEKSSLAGRFFENLESRSAGSTSPVLKIVEDLYQNDKVYDRNFAPMLSSVHYSASAQQSVFPFILDLLFHLKQNGYEVMNLTSLDGIKKAYSERINKLIEVVEKYQFSPEIKAELLEVENKIFQFKIVVPVIGAFSSGKSTLLNRYLGIELLNEDITPETALASELHYAPSEKLVAHYLNGDKREYPLADILTVLTKAEELSHLALYVKNPILAQHSDIVLVDMPGLDSNIESHNKAIRNYIQHGVAFILCVSTELGLRDSVKSFLREMFLYGSDLSLILTKDELRLDSEVTDQLELTQQRIRELGGQDIFVGRVSAFQNRLQDFKKALYRLEQKKEELLVSTFDPVIGELSGQIVRYLKMMSNAENISVPELEHKKQQLEEEIKELNRIMDNEKRRVSIKCSQELPNLVANEVRAVLEQNRSSFRESLKKQGELQGRMEGLINNAFRVSITSRAEQLFQEVSAKVSQYISLNVYTVLDSLNIDGGTAGGEIKAGDDWEFLKSAGKGAGILSGLAGLGATSITIAPIVIPAVIIGGIVGLLFAYSKRQQQEREIQEQLNQVIAQGAESVKAQAAVSLQQMTEHFFAALTEKVGTVCKQMNDQIQLLENQIAKNKQELAERREEIAQDLRQIAKLQHESREAVTL